MSEEKKDVSRRNFLKSGILAASAVAVGAAVFAPFGTNVVKAAESAGTTPATPTTSTCATGTCEPPKFPWPYVELDPEKAKDLAYQGYGKYKCAYGVFHAIIAELKEKVGYPYTVIPTEILQWGGTGGGGWGTLCGALTGAATAINFSVGTKKEVDQLVSELFGWYTTYEFPKYKPAKQLKPTSEIPKSVAGSPLCHVSVSNWCKASNFKAESAERSERCARVSADVAAKTVELLNKFHAKSFVAVYKNETVEECMTCHGEGRSLENTRGQMECDQCHTDVDPKDLLGHIKKNWDILQ